MITIMGICLSLLAFTTQAVDIKEDKALDEELAYLHAEDYVYSAGKKLQKVNDVSTAVFVISQEDIRRSGATNIPETLRMVPGLQVAQIDANKWAISARGLNRRFSNNLLVLMDGRTIYTPVFSGVFWNREDTPLEDIERIEVIRGASAAMWGSNAINGVINIITKSAKDTHGTLLTAGVGNQEQGFASARHGGQLKDNFHYRLYGKGFKRNNNITVKGENAQDDWENYQAGFKTEWTATTRDAVTTQADFYHSHTGDKESFALSSGQTLHNQDTPVNYQGGNIQTRWTHNVSATSDTSLQLYYKQDDSHWLLVTPFEFHEKTIDVDFQHRFNSLDNHDIIWGLGYRYFKFAANQSPKLSFSPAQGNLQLFSGFLQDDITLLPDTLKLTIGTRLEHNDFTGFEIQPNIRLLWKADDKQTVWGAISRAVRIPNIASKYIDRLTNTFPQPLPLPALAVTRANPQMKAETVLEYSVGYRFQPNAQFSFDVAAFYNQYQRLMAMEVLSPALVFAPNPHLEIPIQFTNKMKGESLGIELTAQWQPTDWLKIQPSYWFLKSSLHTPSNLIFADGEQIEKDSPQQQFHLKTSVNLPYHVELDTQLRYVDPVSHYQIPAYVAFDLRLSWKPLQNFELSLVGQNLFNKGHLEFGDDAFELPRTQIQRSLFAKVAVSF